MNSNIAINRCMIAADNFFSLSEQLQSQQEDQEDPLQLKKWVIEQADCLDILLEEGSEEAVKAVVDYVDRIFCHLTQYLLIDREQRIPWQNMVFASGALWEKARLHRYIAIFHKCFPLAEELLSPHHQPLLLPEKSYDIVNQLILWTHSLRPLLQQQPLVEQKEVASLSSEEAEIELLELSQEILDRSLALMTQSDEIHTPLGMEIIRELLERQSQKNLELFQAECRNAMGTVHNKLKQEKEQLNEVIQAVAESHQREIDKQIENNELIRTAIEMQNIQTQEFKFDEYTQIESFQQLQQKRREMQLKKAEIEEISAHVEHDLSLSEAAQQRERENLVTLNDQLANRGQELVQRHQTVDSHLHRLSNQREYQDSLRSRLAHIDGQLSCASLHRTNLQSAAEDAKKVIGKQRNTLDSLREEADHLENRVEKAENRSCIIS